jgi:hypothetical protein
VGDGAVGGTDACTNPSQPRVPDGATSPCPEGCATVPTTICTAYGYQCTCGDAGISSDTCVGYEALDGGAMLCCDWPVCAPGCQQDRYNGLGCPGVSFRFVCTCPAPSRPPPCNCAAPGDPLNVGDGDIVWPTCCP